VLYLPKFKLLCTHIHEGRNAAAKQAPVAAILHVKHLTKQKKQFRSRGLSGTLLEVFQELFFLFPKKKQFRSRGLSGTLFPAQNAADTRTLARMSNTKM
jgi:hypothetical protein